VFMIWRKKSPKGQKSRGDDRRAKRRNASTASPTMPKVDQQHVEQASIESDSAYGPDQPPSAGVDRISQRPCRSQRSLAGALRCPQRCSCLSGAFWPADTRPHPRTSHF
jgi:hypothetical protein